MSGGVEDSYRAKGISPRQKKESIEDRVARLERQLKRLVKEKRAGNA